MTGNDSPEDPTICKIVEYRSYVYMVSSWENWCLDSDSAQEEYPMKREVKIVPDGSSHSEEGMLS